VYLNFAYFVSFTFDDMMRADVVFLSVQPGTLHFTVMVDTCDGGIDGTTPPRLIATQVVLNEVIVGVFRNHEDPWA
jgi:hypothetical protein